jgi:hypothetical protein
MTTLFFSQTIYFKSMDFASNPTVEGQPDTTVVEDESKLCRN